MLKEPISQKSVGTSNPTITGCTFIQPLHMAYMYVHNVLAYIVCTNNFVCVSLHSTHGDLSNVT
jgi:hypothetical protein